MKLWSLIFTLLLTLSIGVTGVIAQEKKMPEKIIRPEKAESLGKPTASIFSASPQTSLCNPNLCPSNSACIQQTFPSVEWRICIENKGIKGLWLNLVYLKRPGSSTFTEVIYEAGPAEIFTPYHEGSTRLYDTGATLPIGMPGSSAREVTQADAGPFGLLVTLPNNPVPSVVAETRDRGVAWLCKGDTATVWRSTELLLWSIYDTGNYDYITQYGFRDDGTITFRLGGTGYNNPNLPTPGPFNAHTHDVLWRVDMDLNGSPGDSVYQFKHEEPTNSLTATDSKVPFNGGVEGRSDWNANEFSTLIIEDSKTNANGNKIGYELVPFREGTARHYGAQEDWTRSDFWVTRYNGSERGFITDTNAPRPDTYLLGFINGQSILNADIVVWHVSSAHHDPHDEDLDIDRKPGVTLIHWTGFELRPHNLFDYNPLGGPKRCGP